VIRDKNTVSYYAYWRRGARICASGRGRSFFGGRPQGMCQIPGNVGDIAGEEHGFFGN
jgi:hypothetical protein